MIQEQGFAHPTSSQKSRRDKVQRSMSARLLSSLLLGVGVTIILTLLVACILLFVNPFDALGNAANRFPALLVLPVHAPQLLLIPLAMLLIVFLTTLLGARPLALVSYLRNVHAAQEEYHKLYTPLTALTNIRRALDSYPQDVTAPTVSVQEEQVSILDLVQQQDAHQLILGVPGAGKTMALRVYQYLASQQPLTLLFRHERIPIYVPMKNYSLFLKKQAQPDATGTGANSSSELPQMTLLDFLQESDLPGMRYLRPYLPQLAQQGRLLLLCDGLNEVDSNYISRVSEELVQMMLSSRNRLVMTCREVDYREQRELVQLVNEGHASRAMIYPLLPEQVHEFVERYVERQDKRWQHTAGQIMQVIDRSRLRYHCTNPMMLFTLMGIIDTIGVERGKQIDTRGRLLRESVKQLIAYERQQAKWSRGAPAEQDVIRFLGEVACAARWANDRNAIQLRISSVPSLAGEEQRSRANFEELADELQFWLDEHPAKGPFVTEDEETPYEAYDDRVQLLQFALSAALIEVSPGGVLSFRHELIAEYFVAEYFFASANKKRSATLSIREGLLENVGRWSEPVAIWAGLLENPLVLAERFGSLGQSNPAYVLQALALGLVCVGVLWAPPQAEIQRPVLLPESMEEALSIAVRNRVAREELARIFTRCAEEGGQEVYRSLLPLIMVDGVDELLTLLDQNIVPELLFTHLQDAVDNVAYEAQVKRLTRVLGRFGGVVVDRALQLSLPQPQRSIRLRAAAINILGGTGDGRAVDPLIARLGDAEPSIVERAANALLRLGPTLTLTRVLQELENRTPGPFTSRSHRAALTILGRFLDEQDVRRQATIMQYQRILETIVPVLTSNYQAEPEVQQQARDILVRQACNTTEAGSRDNRWEKAIEALLRYLPSQNEVAARNVILALQEVGTLATPRLLEQLNQPSDLVRTRVVEILRVTRDLRALPHLLRLLNDPAPSLQQQVAPTLHVYAPESIPGLIELVLSSANEPVADRAAQILSAIGEQVVVPAINVLFHVVPGRTRLLVQVLEHIHDPQAIPALITLLQMPQIEPLLAITIVRALSHFPDRRVVAPLLTVLSEAHPQLYEEGIDALSQLGLVALDGLIAALDESQEGVVIQRVRRAILGMSPFPGEQLIYALGQCSDMQARQIMSIFKMQGPDAAQVLVKHLLFKDERVRDYIYQTLNEMPGALVVPPLLEVLHLPAYRRVANTILLKFPEAAILPLVDLLGEHERGEAAVAILPQFGPIILRPLIAGLDDQRSTARELAQRIIVSLVRQCTDEREAQEILQEIVHLFNPSPPPRAREVLLGVLTNELADVCLPALLEGLEDAHLIDDVSEALVRLMRKGSLQNVVLERLLRALYVEERRRGAAAALVRMEVLAVPHVGELITDENKDVATVAKRILREIGVPALAFIWMAQSDRSNPARRQAALEVFYSMPTEIIRDALISRLISDKSDDIAMAVALLLERIHDEATQHYADRVMIPELIEYVQMHGIEGTNLRVISLLLLLGEHAIIDHLLQALEEYPQHRKQLLNVLLLLGKETQEALLEVFNDPDTTVPLRAEIAGVMGMMAAPEPVAEYAQNISAYGLSATRTSVLFPEQLAISLHALGGLLAGGHWNVRRLQELRDASKEGSPARELFNVLLGWRYEPQLTKLQNDLQSERDAHKKEALTLTARIVADQKRIQALEDDLEQIRREHGFRGDELHQASREKETLRAHLDQVTKEKGSLHANLDQLAQEKSTLQMSLDQLIAEKNMLDTQLQEALQESQELHKQNQQLLWQLNHPKTH